MMTFKICVSDSGVEVIKPDMKISSKLVNYYTIAKDDIIAYYVLSKIYYISDDVRIAVMDIPAVVFHYVTEHMTDILGYYDMLHPERDQSITTKIRQCKKYFDDIELQKQYELIDYLKSCVRVEQPAS
jgi:hypothetical protein